MYVLGIIMEHLRLSTLCQVMASENALSPREVKEAQITSGDCSGDLPHRVLVRRNCWVSSSKHHYHCQHIIGWPYQGHGLPWLHSGGVRWPSLTCPLSRQGIWHPDRLRHWLRDIPSDTEPHKPSPGCPTPNLHKHREYDFNSLEPMFQIRIQKVSIGSVFTDVFWDGCYNPILTIKKKKSQLPCKISIYIFTHKM